LSWHRRKIDDPTFERSSTSHVARVSIMDDMGKFTASDDFSLGTNEDDGVSDLFGEDTINIPIISPYVDAYHALNAMNERNRATLQGWWDALPSVTISGEDALTTTETYGPGSDLRAWVNATPGFIPWATAQGPIFTEWLDTLGGGPRPPAARKYDPSFYGLIKRRWPGAVPYLDAVLRNG
jgi:hypothetical protein